MKNRVLLIVFTLLSFQAFSQITYDPIQVNDSTYINNSSEEDLPTFTEETIQDYYREQALGHYRRLGNLWKQTFVVDKSGSNAEQALSEVSSENYRAWARENIFRDTTGRDAEGNAVINSVYAGDWTLKISGIDYDVTLRNTDRMIGDSLFGTARTFWYAPNLFELRNASLLPGNLFFVKISTKGRLRYRAVGTNENIRLIKK